MNGDGVRITSWDDEIPKHRKKKEKRTPKKANHKHEHEVIIGRWAREGHNYRTGQLQMYIMHSLMCRCLICGHIDYLPWKRRRAEFPDAEPYGQCLDLPKQYPNLPVVDVPRQW